MSLIWLLVFMVVFTLDDRSYGGLLHKWDKEGDGIKLSAVPAALTVLLLPPSVGLITGQWYTLALPTASLAIFWWLYRSIPAKDVFSGAWAPRANERIHALLRHIVAMVGFLLTVALRQEHGDVKAMLTYSVAYCLIATALGIGYGLARDKAEAKSRGLPFDVNALVECLRGAAYGAASWGILSA